MARPKSNDIATHDFAKAIKTLTRSTPVRPKDIELWTYANFQVRLPTESIRKALNGTIDPTACSVELLIALARYFEVEPEALGEWAARRVRPVMALAGPVDPADLPIAQRRCSEQTAGRSLALVQGLAG